MKNLPISTSLFFHMISLVILNFLFSETHYLFDGRSEPSPTTWIGLTVLMAGWFWLYGLQFIWFAYPLYYLSLYFLWKSRWRAAIASSGVAIAIALVSTPRMFQQALPTDVMFFTQPNLQRLELGYYLWVMSLLILFVTSLAQSLRHMSNGVG
ncbi:hypothetical protein C7B61_14000 [filamentous cyanobacterium CCP1]|nr:hypothetical protein C7B61_14000 [filamentous cyanobacterium CCP1]